MKRPQLTLLASLVIILATVQLSDGQNYPNGYNNNNWDESPPWKPEPRYPLVVTKPKNWTQTIAAECPKECAGCCTSAWDQLAWQMTSVPRRMCKFCELARYVVGRFICDDNKCNSTCPKCLFRDFAKVVGNFKCTNDNGGCSKCCMDLTVVYMSRFIFGCPDNAWKPFQQFNYKDTGFNYVGQSECPQPSPRAMPPTPGAPIIYGHRDDGEADLEDLLDPPPPGVSPPPPLGDLNRDSYDYVTVADQGDGLGK